MKSVRWVIQNNLIAEGDLENLRRACEHHGIVYELIEVIPFSPDIPAFTQDEKINIYYGSTSLIYNIYRQLNKPPGLFFDEKAFSMENYLETWEAYMLNSEARVTTFKDFALEQHDNESLWFVRPNADDKSFNGDVRSFGVIKSMLVSAAKTDNVLLNANTRIVVGPPYNIKKEWRNFVVNGKVIASSLYRKDFQLKKSRQDVPADMIAFVEERCREYMPHKIFAMDIALCGDRYYIIECGNFNSVGFYDADINRIVKEVSGFIASGGL